MVNIPGKHKTLELVIKLMPSPGIMSINGMQKVDHVRNSHRVGKLAVELRTIAREEGLSTLRALAGQLKEEQEHNDYYRKMLEVHGIDHEAYYTSFELYLNRIPIGERDHLTYEVLTALMEA